MRNQAFLFKPVLIEVPGEITKHKKKMETQVQKKAIPTMNGTKQVYQNYTAEDQQVWKILFDRQMERLPSKATAVFLEGMQRINFTRDRIPDFNETNEILRKLTGWEIIAVPGIVDDKLFFELMANRKFPATTWLRSMAQLDYLEEPDMFHDVFAHVPLLSNQHFVDFLQSLSLIGLRHHEDAYAIDLLSRIYWFTVEFGLILEKDELRIYGAGILSSAGETDFSLSDKPLRYAFDVDEVYNQPYRKDTFQDKYFIIESYADLFSSIPKIEQVLDEKLKADADK
jgi:phenylalanine-4-hydroxylase